MWQVIVMTSIRTMIPSNQIGHHDVPTIFLILGEILHERRWHGFFYLGFENKVMVTSFKRCFLLNMVICKLRIPMRSWYECVYKQMKLTNCANINHQKPNIFLNLPYMLHALQSCPCQWCNYQPAKLVSLACNLTAKEKWPNLG